jgi:hypothetical protein
MAVAVLTSGYPGSGHSLGKIFPIIQIGALDREQAAQLKIILSTEPPTVKI